MNVKFTVQYDGTRYRGWQKQKNSEDTIQGKLEKAFGEIEGKPVEVIGAGRTDAGVHARGQAANVHLSWKGPLQELQEKVNALLPVDICIIHMEQADDRFHSRFSAASKTYVYRLRMGTLRNVFDRHYVWQLGKPLNVKAMKKAASFLVGEHDFSSFCGHKMKKSAVRRIEDITIDEFPEELRISFTGNGFLQGQVRIMTGTLVEVGEGLRQPESMPGLLEAGERKQAGFTAPARGLTLEKVVYKPAAGRQ